MAADGARVVLLSSAAHRFGDVDLDDPGFDRQPYDAWLAYGRSKTANVLCAVELDRRMQDSGVRAFAVHPGGIQTELGRHLTDETLGVLVDRLAAAPSPTIWKTVPQGAATTVWAATSSELTNRGGLYLEDCGVAEVTDDPDRACGRARLRGRPAPRPGAVGALRAPGSRVRFTYAEAMTDPGYYLPLAQAAEAAGFDGFLVPDSICYPAESDATYPYTADGDRGFLEDKPFLEPFSLIPAMGAVTKRIRFVVSVLKLTVRHPVLVAKQAASAAVLTDDRLTLGVGTSPWPEDYEVCGVPFERRGRRADESIAVLRGLLGGGWFEHHGEIYDVPRIKQSPAPTVPVPIIVGGHAEPALRRAARNDGWIHGGGDPEALPGLVERVLALRAEEGRSGEPFEVHVISMDAYSAEGVRGLEALGVTDVIVGFRWTYDKAQDTEPLQTKIDNLQRYADTVIAATR